MISKEDSWKGKRQFYRLNTFTPIEISVVPPDQRDKLECKEGGQYELKPRIINISGGGLSLRTTEQFSKEDIVKVLCSLMSNNVCVYGKVVKAEITSGGNYHIYIQFLDMPERVRERIISFVFHSEREILRNNLLTSNARFTTFSVRKLILGTVIPTEVFISEDKSIQFLFGAGIFFDNAVKEFLEERKISTIFINDDDLPIFENYLEKYRPRPVKEFLSFKDYCFQKNNYFRVDKKLLVIDGVFSFRTFSMKDFTFTSIDDTMQQQPGISKTAVLAGEKNILIKRAELPLYKEYLEALSTSGKISGDMLTVILKERACILVAEILSDPRNKVNIQKATEVVDELIACMIEKPDSIYNILYLNGDDFYIHIHAVNVAVMCIKMGIELKMPENNLKELGIGALLHDIGYSTISEDIINKMGMLNINEYEVLKSHVIEGDKILRLHDVIPVRAYEAVMQHHEWLSGKAYPFNLPANEMTLFGKLTAICDSYDIMTTGRFHKKPFTSSDALTSLLERAREKQDNASVEIVQRLFNLLGRLEPDIDETKPTTALV